MALEVSPDDATPEEILAVVQAVCNLPYINATEAKALDDAVFDLIDVLGRLGPLLLEYGEQEASALVRERCGDDRQAARECSEVCRTLARVVAAYRARFGRYGAPELCGGEDE
jgi:hypothetical protein